MYDLKCKRNLIVKKSNTKDVVLRSKRRFCINGSKKRRMLQLMTQIFLSLDAHSYSYKTYLKRISVSRLVYERQENHLDATKKIVLNIAVNVRSASNKHHEVQMMPPMKNYIQVLTFTDNKRKQSMHFETKFASHFTPISLGINLLHKLHFLSLDFQLITLFRYVQMFRLERFFRVIFLCILLEA